MSNRGSGKLDEISRIIGEIQATIKAMQNSMDNARAERDAYHMDNQSKMAELSRGLHDVDDRVRALKESVDDMEPIVRGVVTAKWVKVGAAGVLGTMTMALGWVIVQMGDVILDWLRQLLRVKGVGPAILAAVLLTATPPPAARAAPDSETGHLSTYEAQATRAPLARGPRRGARGTPAHREVPSAGFPAPLMAAAGRVASSCPGMRVISGYRPGSRVRGSGRPSLHASRRALDLAGGSYACAYRVLADFPGGVSTDAALAGHIHISWEPGGREWGQRFAHGGHRRRVRLARR